MKWLLLMVIASGDGEIAVNVLSAHETMAECHVAGTFLTWSERMPVYKEALCFPTEFQFEVME